VTRCPGSASAGARQPRFCTVAVALAVILLCLGCESRNPAEVSRERHPELYGTDQPPSAEVETAEPVEPTPDRKTVFEAAVTPPKSDVAEGLEKLDLAAARRSGRLVIRVNDPVFPPRLDAIVDGNTTTLSRTEGVNPLVLRLILDPPIRLRAARVFPSYSSYAWVLEPTPGKDRLLIRETPADEWSAIELEEPVETGEVRLELLRLERDDYVHINELELWVEP
jgi:hypothetical protein